MLKKDKVLILAAIIFTGFIIATLYHYIMGNLFSLPSQYGTFVGVPRFTFTDFTLLMTKIENFMPFGQIDSWVNYFPMMYVLLFPFSKIQPEILGVVIFESIFILLFVFMNYKFLKCKDFGKSENYLLITIISLLTYPFLYILNRGNSDMLLFLPTLGFIYLFKTRKYFYAAILLGVLTGLKPFFIIFCALFLDKKRFKEIFYSLSISFTIFISGFMILKGGFWNQLKIYTINIRSVEYQFNHLISEGMQQTSSIYLALKAILVALPSTPIITTQQLVFYYKFLIIFALIITILGIAKSKFLWEKLTILTFFGILIPPIVFDYKYIFMFIPLWLFINCKDKSKFSKIYTILFGLLLIPKSIILKDFHDDFWYVIFSQIANPILALTLLGFLFKDIFSRKKVLLLYGNKSKIKPKD